MGNDRRFWIALAAITLAYAALPWALAIVPGHDLPQHLAYARILGQMQDPAVRDAAPYYVVEPFDPYFLVHYALAALGGRIGVVAACKVVYSAFAVALPLSSVALARAAWPERAPWSALLATAFVWSPVACMGFLPFMLALPFALLALAAYLRAARANEPARLAVLVVALGLVACAHVVAAGMTLLFVVMHAAWARRRAAVVAAATAIVGCGASVAMLKRASASVRWSDLATSVATFGPWKGVVGFFRLTWTDANEKLGLVLGTVPGPFTTATKLGLAGALAAFVALALTAPRAAPPIPTWKRAYVRAALTFGVACLLVPTAIQVPDDVCLIDLRMLVVAALVGCAAIPPSFLDRPRVRGATIALAATWLVVWGWTLARVSREAEPVLRLARELGPADRVLSLAMRGRSDFLDPANSLTHYLPVYVTVDRGAVTTAFWGDFAPHLPIGYRTAPARPPDWAPWEVEPAHVAAASHVLLERADELDPDDATARDVTRRLFDDDALQRIACDGRWCLFRVVGISALEASTSRMSR